MWIGIGLGSNIGDRGRELALARRWIQSLDAGARFSSEYETSPVDCPNGSPPFRNQVAEIQWRGSLDALLQWMQEYERSRGRRAVRKKNEPRVLDLDLLFAGRNWVQNPRLALPHPRMGERRFVMEPLAELSPGRRIAGLPGTVWETACWLRSQGGAVCQRIE